MSCLAKIFQEDYYGGTQPGGKYAPGEDPGCGGNRVPLVPKRPLIPVPAKEEIPKFVINLDLPPAQRWRHVYEDPIIVKYVDEFLNKLGMAKNYDKVDKTILDACVENLKQFPDLVAELDSIAGMTGIPYEKCVLMNCPYEHSVSVTPACSGIITAQEDGTMIYGKNYDLLPLMNHICFEVTFTRGGKEVFMSVHLPMFIGVHTGMRFGEYSISQNCVFELDQRSDRLEALGNGSQIFEFTFRKFLEDVPNYASLIEKVAKLGWVASSFFALTGKKNEGCVAKTAPSPTGRQVRFQHLNPKEGIWFIYLSNDDWAKPSVDYRRGRAVGCLDSIGRADISEDKVMAVLQSDDVNHVGTDFHWVCTPSKSTRQFCQGDVQATPGQKIARGVVAPFQLTRFCMDGGCLVLGAPPAVQCACTYCCGPLRLLFTPTLWIKLFKGEKI